MIDSENGVKRVLSGAPWESQVGYCRALRVGDHIYVSGTAPVTPDGQTHAPNDAEAQMQRCCEIAMKAIGELGGRASDVVRTRMFVTDISRWREFGDAHQSFFGAHPPVTTMVEVKALISEDMMVEVEFEAIVRK